MGAALYIVLDSPDPGYESFVSGKALSRTEDQHAAVAEQAGVTPLMGFFSMSRDEAEAAAEEYGLPEEIGAGPAEEQWFAPSEGLRTVQAILDIVDQAPGSWGEDVRGELLEFARVLTEAKKHGHRWHLGVDY